MTKFEKIAESLWVRKYPLKLAGIDLGTKMTVAKLKGNRIWLHSVGPITEEDQSFILSKGEVAYVIAPNLFHHLYLSHAKKSFPNAVYYGTRGLAAKRRNFSFDILLEKDQNPPWESEIEQYPIEGLPKTNEVVFFHKDSKTLIVSDLVFNLQKNLPFFTRLPLILLGTYQKFGPSRLTKSLIKDRALFKKSLEMILNLPIEKIVMAHGDVIQNNGKRMLRDAFEEFLR